MQGTADHRFVFLYETRHAELVPVLEHALERAGIPYHSGLKIGPKPAIAFTVAEGRLPEAQACLGAMLERLVLEQDEEDEAQEDAAWEAAREAEELERRRATFPKGAIATALGLVVVHAAIVLAFVGPEPRASRLVELGGLVRRGDELAPWRLLTSLFLHSDLRHVLSNGLSLVAFAVPAIVAWGYGRAALLYLAAGIGGGVAALAAHSAGTVVVGSSGAVAGLFGAWLASTISRARHAPMTRRALVRAIGIGLLVLPSFLTPATSEGRPISVASHLGGLAVGLLVGLAYQRRGRTGA